MIHGLKLEKDMNTKEAVSKFIQEKLKGRDGTLLQVMPNDIDNAHPVPSRKDPGDGPPSIIVHFFVWDTRDAVIGARRNCPSRRSQSKECQTSQAPSGLKKLILACHGKAVSLGNTVAHPIPRSMTFMIYNTTVPCVYALGWIWVCMISALLIFYTWFSALVRKYFVCIAVLGSVYNFSHGLHQ